MSAGPTPQSATEPLFRPPSGPVIGWRDGAVVRATGIPYATAARFEAPRPLDDRAEPFSARGWSPMCPQPADPIADTMFGADPRALPTDEHCQHLSITMPARSSPDLLPVMVWIHGGGYVTGAGDLAVMDPASLVAEQDVVVVTVTYRLGLLGFIQSESGPRANLGLLDQREAFRWIRRNISAFGGDPHNVTAFGQSAGAAALVELMATENAASLFTRAIIQSAPLGIMRGRVKLNRALSRRANTIRATAPLSAIADVQADVIRAGVPFGLKGGMPIAPQYGYPPLPAERDVDAAWRNTAPRIDVLIGSTSEEARLFLPALPGLARWFRMPLVGRVLERGVVAFCTWAVYSRGARRFARRHRRAGGRASRYVLSWSVAGNPIGAAHTIDLPLLFGDETAWEKAELIKGSSWNDVHEDGRLLRAAWASFARGERVDSQGGTRRFLRFRS
ncbi:carboxylesterase family protein [Streptomyces sp. NPDC047917]|uniref:carboxylesterase family protein n=1 Tax=Streptomyces sp. NPDC047917 TaxID=3365491 RepID=UPI00370F9770